MLIALSLCSRTIGFSVVLGDTDSGGNAAAPGICLLQQVIRRQQPSHGCCETRIAQEERKIGVLTAGLQNVSEWLENSAPVAQMAANN